MIGDDDIDPGQELKQIEGIIDSMTPQERENPDLIDISRCRRLAEGSGHRSFRRHKLLKEYSVDVGNDAADGRHEQDSAVSPAQADGRRGPVQSRREVTLTETAQVTSAAW